MTFCVTGTGGRGLDTESIIVTISTRIRTGGDVDWVMPLYSAFLLGNYISDWSMEDLEASDWLEGLKL